MLGGQLSVSLYVVGGILVGLALRVGKPIAQAYSFLLYLLFLVH